MSRNKLLLIPPRFEYILINKIAVQLIPNNVWTTFQFNNVLINNGITFVPAAFSMQAVADGLYAVSAWVAWQNNVTGRRGISIVVNGVRVHTVGFTTYSIALLPAVSAIVHPALPLSLGDTLRIDVFQDSGVGLNNQISGNMPLLTVNKVSEF